VGGSVPLDLAFRVQHEGQVLLRERQRLCRIIFRTFVSLHWEQREHHCLPASLICCSADNEGNNAR
jgi:hypothetical protein